MATSASAIVVEEIPNFTLGLFTRPAVALLDQAGKLLGIALGAGELVIRQVSPGSLGLSRQLLPLAFYRVFVHDRTPCKNNGRTRTRLLCSREERTPGPPFGQVVRALPWPTIQAFACAS